MSAFFTALVLVFLAELGDKTQLIVLSHGSGRKALPTLFGLLVTIAILMGLAVTVGGVIHTIIPPTIGPLSRDQILGIIAGAIFLVFAVITWRDIGEEDDDADTPPVSLFAFLTMFFVAELIDKSSLSAATLATSGHPVWIWAGATVGEFGAVLLSYVAGNALRRLISAKQMHQLGAFAFLVVGVAMITTALWQQS
ncbi:TMEM165/GDT1 family protein [Stomatohabitans albus]|uniref:TMEM165/GDT1 family protein n=1 Tax=Stomatohabitans albus TaxID=3110766 RepID=UPI00300C56B7